jgi:hypothetical protein
VKPWEWNDGLRSWVLPGFHGAWLALGMRLGLAGSTMGEMIRTSWGLCSLLLVWAAWRAGASLARRLRPRVPCCSCGRLRFAQPASMGFVGDAPPDGWQGGLVAAALVAAFPLLAIYSVAPLSELPSMIALIVAFALTAELCEMDAKKGAGHAALVGALLSLAICLRVVNAALVLVPLVWLAARKRWWDLGLLAFAALLPVLIFGVVDRMTWGDYFHSFIAHLRFNLVEGRAAEFGKEPVTWYLTTFGGRLPWGLALLVLPALWGLRATWPFMLSAAGFVACISTQAHKEERFAILLWPLLLIASGAVIGHSLLPSARAASTPSNSWRRALRWGKLAAAALILLVVTVDSSHRLRGLEFTIQHARLDGQAWVARQPKATGLLIDWHYGSGGYLWLGRSFPQMEYAVALLGNPMFSHVMAEKGSSVEAEARREGFAPKFERGGILVLERIQ